MRYHGDKRTDPVTEMKIKIAPCSFQAKQSQVRVKSREDPWKSSSGTEGLGRAWLLLQVHHQEANTKDGRTHGLGMPEREEMAQH